MRGVFCFKRAHQIKGNGLVEIDLKKKGWLTSKVGAFREEEVRRYLQPYL